MAKKVIDGKTYNTATAKMVGDWEFSHDGDFSHCYEALYLSPKGQFFLYGSGGARSKYSQDCGNNNMSGGSGFELLNTDEALDWTQNHDIDADIIAEFFEIEEG